MSPGLTPQHVPLQGPARPTGKPSRLYECENCNRDVHFDGVVKTRYTVTDDLGTQHLVAYYCKPCAAELELGLDRREAA